MKCVAEPKVQFWSKIQDILHTTLQLHLKKIPCNNSLLDKKFPQTLRHTSFTFRKIKCKMVDRNLFDYLLKLVIINTHQWNLCTTTLVKFITTCLTAETLEKQLSTKVTKG